MNQAQFASGMGFQDYLAMMTEARREGFAASFGLAQLSEEDRQELVRLVQSPLFVAAFSEDWCGDCRINLPVLARLAEAAPLLTLHCFSRDKHSDLAAALQVSRIPTFVFFNANWQEIGRFVERPTTVAQALQNGDEESKRLTRIAYNQGQFHADTVEEILDLLRS